MPKITFIQPDGLVQTVEAQVGQSVMQAATAALVPGIIADCGGHCSCATCHGYIEPQWLTHLPPPSAEEAMMLEGAIDVRPNSRLTCQITITEELDGLVVRVPLQQL